MQPWAYISSSLVNGTMEEVQSSEKERFPFSCKTNLSVYLCDVCPQGGAAAIVVRQLSKALFIPASGPPQVASRSASLLPRSKCPPRVTVYSETLLPEFKETHGKQNRSHLGPTRNKSLKFSLERLMGWRRKPFWNRGQLWFSAPMVRKASGLRPESDLSIHSKKTGSPSSPQLQCGS